MSGGTPIDFLPIGILRPGSASISGGGDDSWVMISGSTGFTGMARMLRKAGGIGGGDAKSDIGAPCNDMSGSGRPKSEYVIGLGGKDVCKGNVGSEDIGDSATGLLGLIGGGMTGIAGSGCTTPIEGPAKACAIASAACRSLLRRFFLAVLLSPEGTPDDASVGWAENVWAGSECKRWLGETELPVRLRFCPAKFEQSLPGWSSYPMDSCQERRSGAYHDSSVRQGSR